MRTPLARTADGLIVTRDSRALGEYAALAAARAAGEVRRVRRGVYLETSHAESLRDADRYRVRSLAVAAQRRSPVLAGCSAAVVRGLPLVGAAPAEVYLLAPAGSGRRRNGVVELVRPHARPELHHGVAVTGIVDTLFDVARTCSPLTALVMFDAALHAGPDGALCTRNELEAAFEERLPFPGSARVRAVLDRCTELADSPLESLSRWQIEVGGFPPPELQVPVQLPALGTTVRLDTAWREFGIWGEADGRGKYLPGGDAGATAARVYEEKRREDAIRLATGWRCVRWGWADAWSGEPLWTLLSEAGLPRAVGRGRRA